MGTLGGRPLDDAALREASERAAVDYLTKLWPDLKDGLAEMYLRGDLPRDRWGQLVPPGDDSEPGPADAPGPGSLTAG